jgi:transcription initiation factor TFIIIB Brf1 subunit/transcription initiation factor TFIIB
MSEQHDSTPQTPDEVRADIDRTRAELADTVEALAGRLDVKGRVHDRADELAHNPRAHTTTIGVAAAAVAVIALVVWRKRR